ncbi:MAG TPA: HK97 family phage prohead protease [Bryobacteraceae bacterium]|nr:HK97 family phage prohead protease [Bryobacteraceae bacterium]
MQTKDFWFELKALDETGVFEGKLAVYGNVDEGNDVIEPGAFTKTLKEGGGSVPLLFGHDATSPIGTLQLTDSPAALLAKGKLVLGEIRHLKEVRLFEGSLTPVPMNNLATVTAVKQERAAADMEILESFRNAARDLADFHRRMIDGD